MHIWAVGRQARLTGLAWCCVFMRKNLQKKYEWSKIFVNRACLKRLSERKVNANIPLRCLVYAIRRGKSSSSCYWSRYVDPFTSRLVSLPFPTPFNVPSPARRAVHRIIKPWICEYLYTRAFAGMWICKVVTFFIRLSVQVLEISLITVRWFQTESKEIVMVITSEMRVITALPPTTPIRQVIDIRNLSTFL